MKKHLLLAMSLSMIILSCTGKTKNNPEADQQKSASTSGDIENTEVPATKKYGIKSGIVTFETDMMGMKQKSVLYFDDFGMKEAEEEYEGDNVKKIDLCDGKNRYTVIPKDKAAYESGTCYRGTAYRFAWDEIAEEDQNTKAKKLPNMTVAGKDCESYSYDMDGTSAVYAGWNNICLYLKTTSQSAVIVKKAVSIEEGTSVPADKFRVPSDFEIKQSGF
jgi:hypothetical protein